MRPNNCTASCLNAAKPGLLQPVWVHLPTCRVYSPGRCYSAPGTRPRCAPQGDFTSVSVAPRPTADSASIPSGKQNGVQPAARPEDLALSASQLRQLVQEAFDQRGEFSVDVELLAAQLRTCPTNGLDCGPAGMPSDDALRQQVYGVNALPPAPFVSFWSLVWEALQDRTLVLLMGAGAVSLLLAASSTDSTVTEWIEGIAILASVLIVVSVSSVTNYHKETKFRALNAIKDDIEVRVIRAGKERSVNTHQLLVGDVLVVETGDILPADGVLLQGEEIKVDESHMTGESDDVTKSVSTGRRLMLGGSKVLQGYGRMLVVAVGRNSQQGLLATLVMGGSEMTAPATAPATAVGKEDVSLAATKDVSTPASSEQHNGSATAVLSTAAGSGENALTEVTGVATQQPTQQQQQQQQVATAQAGDPGAALRESTLLTRKLEGLADTIGNVGVAAAGLVFGVNCLNTTARLLLSGQDVTHKMLDVLHEYLAHFITSITILVVAVPEGLPLAVTLALAFSVQRMLKDNNLVRHLDACETMASATTICTDKTGTLTANDMSVVRLWTGGHMYNIRRSSRGRDGESGAGVDVMEETDEDLVQTASRSQQVLQRVPSQLDVLSHVSLSLEDYEGSWPVEDIPSSRAQQNGSQTGTVINGTSVSQPPSSSSIQAALPTTSGEQSVSLNSSSSRGSNHEPAQMSERVRKLLLQSVYLNCTAAVGINAGTGALQKIGNRTECALLEWAMRMDVNGRSCPKSWQDDVVTVQTFPFSSERKRMSALVVLPEMWRTVTSKRTNLWARVLTKGAAEIVMDRCSHYLDIDGNTRPLTHNHKHQLLDRFNQKGLRMLALAARDVTLPSHTLTRPPDNPLAKPHASAGLKLPADTYETGLTLVGLLGLQDPLREDVTAAIQQCHRAGVKVRMLTGDNARTAAHIARDCGILPPHTHIHELLQTSQNVVHSLIHSSLASADEWHQPPGSVVQGAVQGGTVPGGTISGSTTSGGTMAGRGTGQHQGVLLRTMSMDASQASLDHPDRFRTPPAQAHPAVRATDLNPTQHDLDYDVPTFPGPDALQQPSNRPPWLGSHLALGSLEEGPEDYIEQAIKAAERSMDEVPSIDQVQGLASSRGSNIKKPAQPTPPPLPDVATPKQTASSQQQGPASVSPATSASSDQQGPGREAKPTSALQAPKPSSPAAGQQHLQQHGTGQPHTADVTSQQLTQANPKSELAYPQHESKAVDFSTDQVQGQLSKLLPDGAPLVLEGPQFRQLVQHVDGTPNLLALRLIWPHLSVLARCSPTDKHLLVTGLKRIRAIDEQLPTQQAGSITTASGGMAPLHEVVAMTGDGTNDAPALSAADVGFAMNSGTSIAKVCLQLLLQLICLRGRSWVLPHVIEEETDELQDAADILLLDNSFASIVSAVKWGRNVYASVTKFLQFQLTANVVAVVTAGAGALALAHSPLSAVQMLWVNLMMDSLASLALATEAPSDELLDLPPVAVTDPLVTPVVAKHILGQAAYQLGILAALVAWGQELFHCDAAVKDTLVFNTFVCMQLFNQLNCRKVRDEPDVLAGLASSPLFYAIVGGEVIMQVLIVQYGGAAFSTVPLSQAQWAACVGLGAVTLLVRRALLDVKMDNALFTKWLLPWQS